MLTEFDFPTLVLRQGDIDGVLAQVRTDPAKIRSQHPLKVSIEIAFSGT